MKKSLITLVVVSSCLAGCNVTKSVGKSLGNVFDSIVNVMTSPEIPITQLRPAKNDRMASIRINRLAVTSVSGNQTGSFEGRIESELANITVQDQPYFTLIDRATINKVIQEQKFSNSDLADQRQSVRLGRLLGADAILSANYAVSNVESQSYKETRTKCSDSKCKNTYQVTVHCTKHSVTAQMTPKVSSVETGKVLFTKSFSDQASSQKCSDSSSPHLTSSELTGQAISNVFASFSSEIAPHVVTFSPSLIESDDSSMSELAESHLDKGIEFAENEWFDEACDSFAQAQGAFANSLAINYNNGLCSERAGDLEAAEAFYKVAMRTTSDFDDLEPIRNAIKRLKNRRKELIQLAKIEGLNSVL